ncbi:MAG: hypothetical protein ABSH51_08280 [Solirubrobacteraceae bacterium]|jgi:hypothetical protein
MILELGVLGPIDAGSRDPVTATVQAANTDAATVGERIGIARLMVRDALAVVLEQRRTRGEPIPGTGWALVESVEIAA